MSAGEIPALGEGAGAATSNGLEAGGE